MWRNSTTACQSCHIQVTLLLPAYACIDGVDCSLWLSFATIYQKCHILRMGVKEWLGHDLTVAFQEDQDGSYVCRHLWRASAAVTWLHSWDMLRLAGSRSVNHGPVTAQFTQGIWKALWWSWPQNTSVVRLWAGEQTRWSYVDRCWSPYLHTI